MYVNNNGLSMPSTSNDFNTSIEDLTAADLDLIVLDDYSEFYKLMTNASTSALSASSFQCNNYTGTEFKHSTSSFQRCIEFIKNISFLNINLINLIEKLDSINNFN